MNPATPPGIPPTPPSPKAPLPGQPFDPNAANGGPKLPSWVFIVGCVLGLVILVSGVGLLKSRSQPAPIGPFPSETSAPAVVVQSTPVPTVTVPVAAPVPTVAAALKVHVTGHVHWPGVYDMPTNSRVKDAIERAGGAQPDANLDALNLAAYVADGSKITVPARGETVTNPVQGGVSRVSPVDAVATSPININTASQAEIEALPGVGPKLATRIIAVRQQSGGFRTVEDVGNVPGIGPKKLEQMRPYLSVN